MLQKLASLSWPSWARAALQSGSVQRMVVAVLAFVGLFSVPSMWHVSGTTRSMPWAWPWSTWSHCKAVLCELWGHALLVLLCINVGFDLFLITPLMWIFVRPLSLTYFHIGMTNLIHWTTHIVVGPPFAWCGVRIYVNDMVYFQDVVKKENCVLLANHGSRIDWLLGMFVGFVGRNIRVGFVVESFLKYLPFIGWYRNWVCEDIFVARSFKQDSVSIIKTIDMFKKSGTKLMYFLAPEGHIVDQNALGRKYLADCQEFCRAQGYKPFEYVLTPRYKGINVLQHHVSDGGEVGSVTMALVQNGKLLQSKLLSPDYVIADLYTAFAGIGGSPVIVYLFLKKLHLPGVAADDAGEGVKKVLMDDYAWKDECLRTFDETGAFPGNPEMTEFEVPHFRFNLVILLHNLAVVASFAACGRVSLLFKTAGVLFALITASNTVGKLVNGSTMESIPFETAIKPFKHLMMMSHMRKLSADAKKAS